MANLKGVTTADIYDPEDSRKKDFMKEVYQFLYAGKSFHVWLTIVINCTQKK